MIIQSLLDQDLYKFTMGQVVWAHFPNAHVEYEFRCRTKGVDLSPYADQIRAEVDHYCTLRLRDHEYDYLKTIRYLKPSFVDMLSDIRLNPYHVSVRVEPDLAPEDRLQIRIAGNWLQTIFFEVPVLSIVNETYFRAAHPISPQADAEGMSWLAAKCATAKENHDVNLQIMEFGTRRRYSRLWQWQVLSYLKSALGPQFAGSSNVDAAREFGVRPVGTMAHEYLQACQAFVALPDFQKFALDTWMDEFRGDLGIALSDVVGMDAFLRDFDKLLSKAYDGCRQDSGDPITWGEKLIAHYESLGIDPTTKTGVFTDALDMPRAAQIARHFHGRLRTAFGIGTNLTNDLGFVPLQIVIKMTTCNGRPVAKLSDSPGKLMSRDEVYLAYLRQVFRL